MIVYYTTDSRSRKTVFAQGKDCKNPERTKLYKVLKKYFETAHSIMPEKVKGYCYEKL
jgi:hypothetical protein